MNLLRRRCLAGGAVALANTCLPSGASATATRTLRIAGNWELGGLEPNLSGYHFTRAGVLETLVDAHSDGRLQPGLAARTTVDESRLEWRFYLRSGAVFHDGTAVKAGWVARMLARAAARPGLLRQVPLAGVASEGDDCVRLTLKQPYALLPSLLTHSTTAILAPAAFKGDVVERMVGSGAFQIDELVPPQRFSVRAFAGWRGARGHLERASYLSVSRSESRALLAESGQIDVALGLDAASATRLARRPGLYMRSAILPRTFILKVNAAHPWLRAQAFREALSLAIDRPGIARALLRSPELAASELLPPTLADWHQRLPPTPCDPLRARPASVAWLSRRRRRYQHLVHR